MSGALALVHLVRQANGLEPFDAFLSSYRRHEPGCEHELVLLCKGFPDPEALASVRRRARELGAHELAVPDDGLDLTAYLAAARELRHERLCFVNSFSEILCSGWLNLLGAALDRDGAGAAGASGSWASHRSFALSLLRLPNGYRGTLGDRRAMTPALRSVSTAPKVGTARRLARAATNLLSDIAAYPGFPASHLRTNGFAIRRELLLALADRPLETKNATYRFEAGRRGLTAQLHGRGLKALVVGRDGVARDAEHWPDADVFWQGDQSQLLLADNQTRQYDAGSATVREALSRYAWGPQARPG